MISLNAKIRDLPLRSPIAAHPSTMPVSHFCEVARDPLNGTDVD
jgi:hypothetical protein